MHPAWKRHALTVWSGALALLVLAPALAPGYVLHLDMVFVPTQTLLPWNLGIGGGLPRSVPQDAVVSLLAGPLPGQILQKVVLLASFVLAGVGAGRLAGTSARLQLPAASLYLWSAFTASRLLMGHWGLLWAYAVLPWALIAARNARSTGRWAPVGLLCAIGALVPTGGLVVSVAAVPLAGWFGSAMTVRGRWLLAGTAVAVNAPWWLPAIRSDAAGVSDPLGLVVFGARADGPGGVLLSVLGGGGVWNSEATLGSRTTWFAALGVLVVFGLAALGWRTWLSDRRPEAVWLTALGVSGLAWAWLSGVAAHTAWAQQLVSSVPGAGLLRDGQKWTIFWVLVLAVCAPRGLALLSARAERVLAIFLVASLALVPLAVLPDLAWGGFGRLKTSNYPAGWDEVRTRLADDERPGDVASLPWAAFRRYEWNHQDVVLDPLPRFLTRTVVWNDSLPVSVDGELAEVGGDDPRAEIITAAIRDGVPLGPVLGGLGIRWVVVQTDQPAPGRQPDLTGTRRIGESGGLVLLEVQAPVTVVASQDVLVVAVDVIVALLIGFLAVSSVHRRRPRDTTSASPSTDVT